MDNLDNFIGFAEEELTSETFSVVKRRKKNKSDIVFQLIRQGLILGRWKPGDRLHDNELAEMFGCSRNSVREALSNLIRLHIVEKVHYWKGYRVRIPDWEEILEAIELRASLDYIAFEKLVKIDDANFDIIIKQLANHIEKAKIIIAAEPEKGRKVNAEFFHIIYSSVSDYLLEDVVDNISAIPELLSFLIHSLFKDLAKNSHLWQVKIYDELKNKNLDGVGVALRGLIKEYKEVAHKAYLTIPKE